MKTFSKFLKNLEKRKIITRKPHPIIPFILGLVILIILRIATITQSTYLLINILIALTIFTFIFAILHLVVVIFLKK